MEPLQIEVSTAGNNPDGYGKSRFDLAREVEKGAVETGAVRRRLRGAPGPDASSSKRTP
jgi:hypothetical protein